MSGNFNPIETWVWYGLSDLFFGYVNQNSAFYKYGTFFYIMAVEKHLKAVLIYENSNEYADLTSLEEKKTSVERIAKKYSHKFKMMIDEVGGYYAQKMNESFITEKYLGFNTQDLITSMTEGYMETRYPSLQPTSRHYPANREADLFHAPLGSSFFTEFCRHICTKCWKYLASNGINISEILDKFTEKYSGIENFENFKNQYLSS